MPAPALVTAQDLCDANPVVSFEETFFPGDCPNSYKLLRIWTAVDACGNTAYAGQLVDVVDDQAPTFICGKPAPLVVDCWNIPEPMDCVAVDNCDGEVEVT
ncbi:hypothetical protein V6O07_14140, partial [Arthrospira platensis SPKY2]